MKNEERRIYRIAEITGLIKSVLERSFGDVWVEGEISNLRRPSSGHLYFTLKDESAQIRGVMFRGDQVRLGFELADGVKTLAFGRITVYERSGEYQIVVRRVEEAGKGSLQAAFEALKKKLQEEGLFDPARKRPLPLLPRHIGIVTSPTGAAIRDILKILSRRFPNIHVVIAPAKVQGECAAGEVAEAIELLGSRGGLDVLIVGRGGGSVEDLWCFNEEKVARAIAASTVPVISAVGHETDFTISDFVADARAPTPSAAAEQVVNSKDMFEQRLRETGALLVRSLRESLLTARNRLIASGRSEVFTEPRYAVRVRGRQVNELRLRLAHSCLERVRGTVQTVDDAALRLSHCARNSLSAARQDAVRIRAQLRALNPHAVLTRGYSITRDAQGRVLRTVEGLGRGQKVKTTLAVGEFESEIAAVRRPGGA